MRSSNYANKTIEGEQQQPSWELTKADLATLLDLSRKLNLDGEITPVMAWGMMLAHPRLGEFGRRDFGWLTEELGRKVKCYGYVQFSPRPNHFLASDIDEIMIGLAQSWRNSRFGMRLRVSSLPR